MTKSDLLEKLSIRLEPIEGFETIFLLMFEDNEQIGCSDGPKEMIIDFSDEELRENMELSDELVSALQEHEAEVRNWLVERDWKPVTY